MKKILDYQILMKNSLKDLEEEIEDYLRDGWQPYGDLKIIVKESYFFNEYIQTMVTYDDVKDE